MKKGRGSLEKTESRDAWIMMTPALIVLTIVAVYPILRTFWLSLHEMVLTDPTSGYPFVGLGNYIKIFQDSRALTALVFTLKFTVVTVFFETILGFISAMIMNQGFKAKGFVRAAILIPWAIPTSVSAMMWKFIYNDQYGLFNDVLPPWGDRWLQSMAQYFKWFLYGAGHHGYLENSAVYGTSDPCRAADGSG